MKVLIVDDEPLARQRLRRLLADIPCEPVGEAAHGAQALELAAQLQPDVVLLDIQMPGMDGLMVAGELARQEPAPAVIFCTAFDEFAVQAFAAAAIGYLLKPIEAEPLQQALQAARRLNRAQLAELDAIDEPNARRHLLVRTARGVESLPLDNIRYFRADQKYVSAIFPGGERLISESLKQLEDEFGDQFLRAHRNALVAQRYLTGLEKAGMGQYRARLDGVEQGPLISRRHLAELRRRLQGR